MKHLMDSISEFVDERDWNQFHSPKNLSMALGVEVAELQEHFQWLTQEESGNLAEEKRQSVKEEIGDIFIYLIRLCQVLDIDPVNAANEKLAINKKKYPINKAKGSIKKYTEL